MPNLVIILKRLSVEEIEVATGHASNKDSSAKEKKIRKQKKSSRITNNEKIENPNEKSDEAGINCRKKIQVKKMTKQVKNLDQNERRNVGISKQNVTEKIRIVTDERVEICEKLTKKNKSKVNIRTIEKNSVPSGPTNDDNLTHTSKINSQTTSKNDESKCSKRRVEITGSENIINPAPKKRKMSIDQKVNDSGRVTRSKTKALKSNISNINENETSEAKTADKVPESDQNVKKAFSFQR